MRNYNWFSIYTGHYDMLHPSEFQKNVRFNLRDDAPFESRGGSKGLSIIVDEFDYEAEDFDTIYDCAMELKRRVDKYLVNSDKRRLEILIPYLEKYLYADKLESLLEEKTYLIERMAKLDKRIISVEGEMAEGG